MPYTTNPTFADANILSAAQLQILADNAAFLYSLVSGVNIPVSSQTMIASGDSRRYVFRHKARYLHFQFRLTGGDSDELEIRVGASATAEYTDATNRSATYQWNGYIDLEATTEDPAMGAFYAVFVEFNFVATGEFIIDYFLESDATIL